MKISFTCNPMIEAFLTEKGYGVKAVNQSAESTINSDMHLHSLDRGNLRHVKKQNNTPIMPVSGEFKGDKQTVVSKFVAWNDQVGQMAKRGQKIGAMVTVTTIPDATIAAWLENYRLPVQPANPQPESNPGNPEAEKGKGKGKGKKVEQPA